MLIEYKIRLFCNLLVSLNWELVRESKENLEAILLSNKTLYDEIVSIRILKNYRSPDFSRQMILTIRKAIQLDERIRTKQQTNDLIEFLKNYERQNSKTKEDWIIPEPDSKYTENEIPSIYIP